MIKKPFAFLLLILGLFSVAAFPQGKQPLKAILISIEKQHQVRFNYIEDVVAPFEIPAPETSLLLQQKLDDIHDKTGLLFETINGKYIIITAGKKEAQVADSLNIPTYDLTEILIENYLTTGISKKNNGTFLIKPKKFGILPGLTETDILQTMQQIPGIYSADESISNINVRGGTHDQNLFLWNGIRMFQTGHFFGLISAFNPSLANTITISRNGTSAFYGESVSSTAVISTLSDNIEDSNAAVGINLIDANLYAKIKLSKSASFEVSSRRSFTDVASSPTYRKYYDRIFQNSAVADADRQIANYHADENFFFYDFTAQYQQKFGSKSELVLDGIVISNELGIHQNAIINEAYNSKYSSLEQQNTGANISWKTNWNASNFTKISAYFSNYNLSSVNESIESNQVLNQTNSILDSGLRIENHHKITPHFTFNNGYQYNEIGIINYDAINAPAFKRNIKEVLRSHALVLETQYTTPNNKAFLTAGIRTNYFEKFRLFLVEPRIQFNYALNSKLNLEVLYEQKNQTASQIIDLQRDFLGIEKRRWTLANNSDIPIQKSHQVSVGASFKDKKWLVTIDNFYKKITGISSPGQAFRNQLEALKINGDYIVMGSEILVQRNFGKFYSWLSYSFNHNEYQFDSYDPPQFPNNFEIRHSVSWAGIYDWHKLKLALGSKCYTGRPATTPAGIRNQQLIYNEPNNTNLGDFVQFNFSASYYWNLNAKTKLQLNASVLNLFNKKNMINRYYRVNAANNTIESAETYSLERTPNLSMRVSF